MRCRYFCTPVVALMLASGIAWGVKPKGVSEFMRLKLGHSQAVLEGLATEDFRMIEKAAQAMSAQSMEESWQVFETPEYLQHSSEFRRAADTLSAAARDKNLDGSALAFVGLTLKCVQCHKYVRDVQMAGLELSPATNLGGE